MFGLFGIFWLAGLIFIIVYSWKILSDEKFLRKVITWQNSAKGVKTEITPATIRWTRFGATCGLFVAVIMVIIFLLNFLYFSSLLRF